MNEPPHPPPSVKNLFLIFPVWLTPEMQIELPNNKPQKKIPNDANRITKAREKIIHKKTWRFQDSVSLNNVKTQIKLNDLTHA
jgi:hypothetical protein